MFGIIVGNYISNTTTPLYRSSADLFISTPASAIDLGLLATGSNFSQERVKSYIQIINAPDTLRPVIEKLKLNTTPESLASRISATAPPETVVIRLEVVDTNPERASAIANEVAIIFSSTVYNLELSASDSSSPVKVSVARPAVPNYGPISPKRGTNQLLGVMAFFLLSFSFFLLRFLLDRTVKNVSNIGKETLLAAIGFDPEADSMPLISQLDNYHPRTESFRVLRTNLLNCVELQNLKIICVTSTLPEEGKSTTAINLALSLSNQGLKVLLLEGDLRRPRIAQYLNFYDEFAQNLNFGMSGILASPMTKDLGNRFSASLIKVNDCLDTILSGTIPENPSELLASENLDKFFDYAKNLYDLVLVDCPPVLPVADAAVVCGKGDAVIVVAHAGKTKIQSFDAATEQIHSIGANLIGVVLNKIPNTRESEDYGYASGYKKYYRRSYRYGFRVRGYVPYGPYGERLTISQDAKKESKISAKTSQESENSDYSKSQNLIKIFSGKRKRHEVVETNPYDSISFDVEQFLNSITAKKPTAKKPTAKKPTAKKPTAKKPTAKKPTAKKPTTKI
jgi:capsular exopolysaccharide synthesis family protein